MALTSKLTAIANAIRTKLGTSGSMTLDQMATNISNIPSGDDTGPILSGTAVNVYSATATKLALSKFNSDTNLVSLTLPNATEICERALSGCNSIQTFDAPNISKVGDYAFFNAQSLRSVNCFPRITNIVGSRNFQSTGQLAQEASFDLYVGGFPTRLFQSSGITSIYAPGVNSLAQNCFQSCKLRYGEFPVMSTISKQAFYQNDNLRWISFDYVESLPNLTATDSIDLATCPYLKIYVPDALVADVATATNWAALSSRVYPLSQKPANQGHIHVSASS